MPLAMSVPVLLRTAADGLELTGAYEREFPGQGPSLRFRYAVVRVWELPPDRLLEPALPLLPLAPVSKVAPEQLPAVLTAVATRLRDEAEPERMWTLWSATQVLLGLHHPQERVQGLTTDLMSLIMKSEAIKASSVYQGIFAEGEAKGRAAGEAEGRVDAAREILIRQGRKKWGEPDEQVLARIAAIGDLDRLNLLSERILDATSWDDLLAPGESGV